MTNQGQSFFATVDKERCLGSSIAVSTRIANGKFKHTDYQYWHCDANAGCGWNEEAGVEGSPIVFHRVAEQNLVDLGRQAFFCDHNESALRALAHRLEEGGWNEGSRLLFGDNEDGLEVFAECIRKSGERSQYAIGSVIVDPNGYWYRNGRGEGAPVKTLVSFSREFPRIDIILNLNTYAYILQRGAKHDVIEPWRVLASLNKKHWLVRSTNYSGHRFLLAVGRNIPTSPHAAVGFHSIESEAGREIMLAAEGKRQKSLFDVPSL